MKLHVLSPCATGKIDGTVKHQIIDRLPNQVSLSEADVVVVPVSYFPRITISDDILSLNKPYILLDYCEYGPTWDEKETILWGKNHSAATDYQDVDWRCFDDWVNYNPPILTFKRELLQKNACSTIKPLEFICHLEPYPIQTREQYDARPLECSFTWGYSHESRPRLHGDIFKAMATHSLGVISDWDQFHPHFSNNPPARTWATIHVPWYARKPIADVMWLNERSKIGVSCYGRGLKSFRSSEMRSTIHALPEDNLAWSFPWVHGQNCLKFRNGHEFEDLEQFTHRDDLYEIYCASEANLDHYRPHRYIQEYLLPAIQEVL